MSIRLEFLSSYKSITQFNTQELPDFTVVTGFNGCGKTQLLEAIGKGPYPQHIKALGENIQIAEIRLIERDVLKHRLSRSVASNASCR